MPAPVPLERVEVTVRTDDKHAFETRRVLDVGAREYLRCSLVIPLTGRRLARRSACSCAPQCSRALCRCLSELRRRRSSLRAQTLSRRAVDEVSDGFVRWPLPDALAYTQLQYAPDNSGDDSVCAAAAAFGQPEIAPTATVTASANPQRRPRAARAAPAASRETPTAVVVERRTWCTGDRSPERGPRR